MKLHEKNCTPSCPAPRGPLTPPLHTDISFSSVPSFESRRQKEGVLDGAEGAGQDEEAVRGGHAQHAPDAALLSAGARARRGGRVRRGEWRQVHGLRDVAEARTRMARATGGGSSGR